MQINLYMEEIKIEGQNNEKEEPKQMLEGIIGKIQDNWQKNLPPEIEEDMVDVFLGSDGLYHWHLKPEFIKDEQERKKYKAEKNMW